MRANVNVCRKGSATGRPSDDGCVQSVHLSAPHRSPEPLHEQQVHLLLLVKNQVPVDRTTGRHADTVAMLACGWLVGLTHLD